MSTQRSSVLRNVYSQINCPTKCPPPQNVYHTKVLSQIVYPSKCLLTDSLSYKMSTHRTSILLHKCLRVDSLSYKKSTHRSYILKQRHLVSTHRGVKGVGNHFFSQIEPNWPLPYSTVPVPLLRDTRPAGHGSTVSVYARVQCREPKTGHLKVQFSRKTKYFADLWAEERRWALPEYDGQSQRCSPTDWQTEGIHSTFYTNK